MDIVLTTLNARYTHSAFGLRYLRANLGALADQTEIVEFNIQDRPIDIVEALVHRQPAVLGLGVYIWNAEPALRVVELLRAVAPEIVIVLGGPEVSYETTIQPLYELADYVVVGEGEVAFRELCESLDAGTRPDNKVIHGGLPDVESLALPYGLYTDEDCAQRVIYVEASRGCPFRCEFCLSALDKAVRGFPLDAFLAEMETLLERGVRRFKFVDRTFNLKLDVARRILNFFLERMTADLFVHFEMIPDRFPAELRELVAAFPPGALQFEVGVQTLTPEVEKRISRRQNHKKLHDNLRYLTSETGVHIHADLIIGLPGETVETFAAGFDALWATGVHEIQVGVLKRLRGAPVIRHTEEWAMVYSPRPPYEILRNSSIDFALMNRLKRFARYWDVFANSGRHRTSLERLVLADQASAFSAFLEFSDWTYDTLSRTSKISLGNQYETLFRFATDVRDLAPAAAARAIYEDMLRHGRVHSLEFLAPYFPKDTRGPKQRSQRPSTRQHMHAATADGAER